MPNDDKKYRNKLDKLGISHSYAAGSRDTGIINHVDFNKTFDYASSITISDLSTRSIDVDRHSVTILSSSTNHVAVSLPATSTTGRMHTIFVDAIPEAAGLGIILSGNNTTLSSSAAPHHQFLHSGSGATCRFNGALWSVLLHGSGSMIS